MGQSSIAELSEKLQIPTTTAKHVHRILYEKELESEEFKSAMRYLEEKRFHSPMCEDTRLFRLYALNGILNGEYIKGINKKDAGDPLRRMVLACYINRGDTSQYTILYDTRKKALEVTTLDAWLKGHRFKHIEYGEYSDLLSDSQPKTNTNKRAPPL